MNSSDQSYASARVTGRGASVADICTSLGSIRFWSRLAATRRALFVSLMLLVVAAPGMSADRAAVGDGSNLLRSAPDGDLIERLRGLPPGHGINLGDAAVVGEFNDVARRFSLHRTGPRGRDFSIRMVWAPERERAIFLGANHGSPHRLNDVWEFDLGAMEWRLLYAPDNPRSYAGLGKDHSDVVFRDGVLMTHRGGPAVIGHTWWGLSYDPVQRRVLYMNTWPTKQDRAVRDLGGDPEERFKGPPLWSFDPASETWEAIKSSRPYPRAPFAGLLEFVDSLGGAIWHSNNWQMRATWLFSAEDNTWEQLAVHGKELNYLAVVPLHEQVGYYDPRRNLLVVSRATRTSHFDIAQRRWYKTVDEPAESDKVPDTHDARTVFHYHPPSGNGILVDLSSNQLWSYEPDSHAWQKLTVQGDPMPTGRKRLAYFDVARNVVVVLNRIEVWAYRYAPQMPD